MPVVRIQFRRNSSVEWTSLNPVLAAGEPGYETDTGKVKVGDGVTAWNQLVYSTTGDSTAVTQEQLVDHVNSETPHPVYDDGPSLSLLYQNAKV